MTTQTRDHAIYDTAGKTMPTPPKRSRVPKRDAQGKSLPVGAHPRCERCDHHDAFRDCDGMALCLTCIFDTIFPGWLPDSSPCTAANVERRVQERLQKSGVAA